jgi:hypothetical protein
MVYLNEVATNWIGDCCDLVIVFHSCSHLHLNEYNRGKLIQMRDAMIVLQFPIIVAFMNE